MNWPRVIEVCRDLLTIVVFVAMFGVALVIGLRVMEDVFQ